jgi:hypothetical protein
VYALTIALLAFGLADTTLGHGLVAKFVAALAPGAAREELPRAFTRFNENLSTILQGVTFVLFGAPMASTGFQSSTVALVAFIVFVLLVARSGRLARPSGAASCRARSGRSSPGSAPRAWPRFCSRCLCSSHRRPTASLVFDIAAFVILASIVANVSDRHGGRPLGRAADAGARLGLAP